MDYVTKPFRSVLYIPGSKQRAMDKAVTLMCDALILDLEDAVAAEAKAQARTAVAAMLRSGVYQSKSILVRVNGFDTDWAEDDLAEICDAGPEAVLLPKVNRAEDIRRLEAVLAAHPNTQETYIWAMMESPLGILNAQEIAAASPQMKGMVLGTNDLFKDLEAQVDGPRTAVLTSLSQCILAARAYGLLCIDGVYNALRDQDGLQVECDQGRMLGFDGKSLIHPDQLEIANTVFHPSEAELDLAKRQIEAFDLAQAQGQGVAVLDGRIVENLHVATARKLLAKAGVITAYAAT